MKKIFFYSLLLLGMGCVSDSKSDTALKVDLESVPDVANVTVEKAPPLELARVLADSANKSKDYIPHFFFNHMMDYENPWLADHRDFSVRKLIFDSTNNILLLKKILESADPRLKKTVDSLEVSDLQLLQALPFRNLSNYKMAQIRLTELQKEKK